MKKTKLEKGITLVALIITIVVLLILAVVSIGAVRDSEIIGHATNTTSESTVAEEGEIVALAVNEWQLQKNTPNNVEDFKTAIETALKNEKESGKVKKISENEDGSLTIIFNKTDNKYKITAEGEISRVTEDLPNEPDDSDLPLEPDDDEKLTYADFWEAAYALHTNDEGYWCISHNICIYWYNYDEGNEWGAELFFGENGGKNYLEDLEFPAGYNMCYFSGDIPIDGLKEQVWYYAISGSEIDYSQSYTLPDEVKNLKSGTAYEGYEELCELFNKVLDAYAQS